MKTSKRYPKVKATNGAVFELGARYMLQVEQCPLSVRGFSMRHRATKKNVRAAFSAGGVTTTYTCWDGGNFSPLHTSTEHWDHEPEAGAALAIGCMNFNKADATKIRRWAKGAKRDR